MRDYIFRIVCILFYYVENEELLLFLISTAVEKVHRLYGLLSLFLGRFYISTPLKISIGHETGVFLRSELSIYPEPVVFGILLR